MEEIISGKNNVLQALKSGRTINRVYLAEGIAHGFSDDVREQCRKKGIVCQEIPRQKLEKIAGENNRGIAAEVSPIAYVSPDDILDTARKKSEPPLIVMLDGVEDPHNLGAVMRSALSAGAHGLIIPKRRAAAVGDTAARAASGAAEYLPVSRITNLAETVRTLKKAGIWTAAAATDGKNLWQCDLSCPLLLILGAEGRGVSPLLRDLCDFDISLPMRGPIESLNVSAAAAIILYEALRQRNYL